MLSFSHTICLHHVGTFLGRSAAESEADCEACYPGSYCPSWGQTSVDLLCPPGWFCPPGSVSGHQPGTAHIIRGQLRLNHGSLCTSSFSSFNAMSYHVRHCKSDIKTVVLT